MLIISLLMAIVNSELMRNACAAANWNSTYLRNDRPFSAQNEDTNRLSEIAILRAYDRLTKFKENSTLINLPQRPGVATAAVTGNGGSAKNDEEKLSRKTIVIVTADKNSAVDRTLKVDQSTADTETMPSSRSDDGGSFPRYSDPAISHQRRFQYRQPSNRRNYDLNYDPNTGIISSEPSFSYINQVPSSAALLNNPHQPYKTLPLEQQHQYEVPMNDMLIAANPSEQNNNQDNRFLLPYSWNYPAAISSNEHRPPYFQLPAVPMKQQSPVLYHYDLMNGHRPPQFPRRRPPHGATASLNSKFRPRPHAPLQRFVAATIRPPVRHLSSTAITPTVGTVTHVYKYKDQPVEGLGLLNLSFLENSEESVDVPALSAAMEEHREGDRLVHKYQTGSAGLQQPAVLYQTADQPPPMITPITIGASLIPTNFAGQNEYDIIQKFNDVLKINPKEGGKSERKPLRKFNGNVEDGPAATVNNYNEEDVKQLIKYIANMKNGGDDNERGREDAVDTSLTGKNRERKRSRKKKKKTQKNKDDSPFLNDAALEDNSEEETEYGRKKVATKRRRTKIKDGLDNKENYEDGINEGTDDDDNGGENTDDDANRKIGKINSEEQTSDIRLQILDNNEPVIASKIPEVTETISSDTENNDENTENNLNYDNVKTSNAPDFSQNSEIGLDNEGDRVEFQMHGLKGPESYKFGYDTGKGENRQFRYEERDGKGKVKGHYGYYDKDGKLQVFNYAADENGYQLQRES